MKNNKPGVLPEEALDDLIKQTRTLDMEEVKREIAGQQQEAQQEQPSAN